jgi:hypothetical protein
MLRLTHRVQGRSYELESQINQRSLLNTEQALFTHVVAGHMLISERSQMLACITLKKTRNATVA